jgi:PDZ domain-containing protein
VVVAVAVVPVLLGAGARFCPLPYVVLERGPTVDTLGRGVGRQVITVGGGEASVRR